MGSMTNTVMAGQMGSPGLHIQASLPEWASQYSDYFEGRKTSVFVAYGSR
jgi:hypothetical protein